MVKLPAGVGWDFLPVATGKSIAMAVRTRRSPRCSPKEISSETFSGGGLGEKLLVAIGLLPPPGRRPVNRVLDEGQFAQLGSLALLAGLRLAVLNVLHDGAAGGQSANRRDQKKRKSS